MRAGDTAVGYREHLSQPKLFNIMIKCFLTCKYNQFLNIPFLLNMYFESLGTVNNISRLTRNIQKCTLWHFIIEGNGEREREREGWSASD